MKKFSKVTGAIALSAAMVFGSVISIPGQEAVIQASTNNNNVKAKAAYESFMGQNKKISVQHIDGYDFDNAQSGKFQTSAKKVSLKNFIHYVYQDLNKDGTTELIVSTNRRSDPGYDNAMICTYKDGEVVPVIYITGIRGSIYNTKSGKLCVQFGNSSDDTYTFLKFNGTAMKHAATYRHEYYNIGNGKQAHHYYKNDKKIKKAVFTAAQKQLTTEIDL